MELICKWHLPIFVINNRNGTGFLDDLKNDQNLGSNEKHSSVNFKEISYLVTSKASEIYMLWQMHATMANFIKEYDVTKKFKITFLNLETTFTKLVTQWKKHVCSILRIKQKDLMEEELIATVYVIISAFTAANFIEKKIIPSLNTPKYPSANQPLAKENNVKQKLHKKEKKRENWCFLHSLSN